MLNKNVELDEIDKFITLSGTIQLDLSNMDKDQKLKLARVVVYAVDNRSGNVKDRVVKDDLVWDEYALWYNRKLREKYSFDENIRNTYCDKNNEKSCTFKIKNLPVMEGYNIYWFLENINNEIVRSGKVANIPGDKDNNSITINE